MNHHDTASEIVCARYEKLKARLMLGKLSARLHARLHEQRREEGEAEGEQHVTGREDDRKDHSGDHPRERTSKYATDELGRSVWTLLLVGHERHEHGRHRERINEAR